MTITKEWKSNRVKLAPGAPARARCISLAVPCTSLAYPLHAMTRPKLARMYGHAKFPSKKLYLCVWWFCLHVPVARATAVLLQCASACIAKQEDLPKRRISHGTRGRAHDAPPGRKREGTGRDNRHRGEKESSRENGVSRCTGRALKTNRAVSVTQTRVF